MGVGVLSPPPGAHRNYLLFELTTSETTPGLKTRSFELRALPRSRVVAVWLPPPARLRGNARPLLVTLHSTYGTQTLVRNWPSLSHRPVGRGRERALPNSLEKLKKEFRVTILVSILVSITALGQLPQGKRGWLCRAGISALLPAA